MVAKVAIAIPSAGIVSTTWTQKLASMITLESKQEGIDIVEVVAVTTAVPDHNKNNSVYHKAASEQKNRWGKTDTNRNMAVGATSNGEAPFRPSFFDSKAEWIFWIDDDTVPPPLALTRLLQRKREFVAGVYFNHQQPYNPIAYLRRTDGLYHNFYNYPPGTLVQVDSVGMGCTLIHRSVYERIMEAYELWVLPTGTVTPMLQGQIKDDEESQVGLQSYIKGGYMHVPVRRSAPENNQPWPFYQLEYGRTEDHPFCEKAATVGARPWLDTTIECEHLKLQAVLSDHFRRANNERLEDEYERLQAEVESAGRGSGSEAPSG